MRIVELIYLLRVGPPNSPPIVYIKRLKYEEFTYYSSNDKDKEANNGYN
jgi:hypothetical protein